jgi:hypothetical protein
MQAEAVLNAFQCGANCLADASGLRMGIVLASHLCR